MYMEILEKCIFQAIQEFAQKILSGYTHDKLNDIFLKFYFKILF